MARLKELVSRLDLELGLVAEFSARLVEARTCEDVAHLLADSVKPLLDCDSLVVFLAGPEGLSPHFVQTESEERLHHSELLQLEEPIIEQSWGEQRSLERTDQALTDVRIFHTERTSATFLMQENGLLYLGRRQAGGFPARSTRAIAGLAQQAGLALESVRRAQDLEKALTQVEEAYHRLEESEMSLVQSSKLAAVGQLAAGVAHELNTPLATVLLEVDFLEMELDGQDEAISTLTKVRKELLRAQEIVGSLLYYSRDAAKGDKEVDLNQVVQDAVDLVGSQVRENGAELRVIRSPVALRVWGNGNELQQIVLNLLLNARDATRNVSSAIVEVRTESVEGQACLSVGDNGCGVADEVAARIFDPFFTTKPVGQGTGLGLSISRRLAERHGGSLNLQKGVGDFCTFVLRIPERE